MRKRNSTFSEVFENTERFDWGEDEPAEKNGATENVTADAVNEDAPARKRRRPPPKRQQRQRLARELKLDLEMDDLIDGRECPEPAKNRVLQRMVSITPDPNQDKTREMQSGRIGSTQATKQSATLDIVPGAEPASRHVWLRGWVTRTRSKMKWPRFSSSWADSKIDERKSVASRGIDGRYWRASLGLLCARQLSFPFSHTPALAQEISVGFGDDTSLTERAVQLVILLTVLSLAPSILVMTTSFVRIVVVLSLSAIRDWSSDCTSEHGDGQSGAVSVRLHHDAHACRPHMTQAFSR